MYWQHVELIDRAAKERNGHIRWLQPEYQAPTKPTPPKPLLLALIANLLGVSL